LRGVERRDRGAIAEDVDLLDRDIATGEIHHAEFVDEVRFAIGAGEGDGGVGDFEEDRCHGLRRLLRGSDGAGYSVRDGENEKDEGEEE
jgi:hypothetical protein